MTRRATRPSILAIDDTQDNLSLKQALTKMAKSDAVPVAGKVQLLRFDRLREELGTQWERLRLRVDQTIRSTIERYLTVKDFYRRFHDYGYLILFAELSRDEAEAKCALIRREVAERLLGEADLVGRIEISTAVATVTGEIKLDTVGSLDELFQRLTDPEEVAASPSDEAEAAVVAAEGLAEEPAEIPADAPAQADGKGAIDPRAIKNVFGDDSGTFRDILQVFVDPATNDVKEIETAFDERSAAGVAAAAHKLKSSSRAVGAHTLANLCLNLEMAGRSENWKDIEASVPRLGGVLREVTDFIGSL